MLRAIVVAQWLVLVLMAFSVVGARRVARAALSTMVEQFEQLRDSVSPERIRAIVEEIDAEERKRLKKLRNDASRVIQALVKKGRLRHEDLP